MSHSRTTEPFFTANKLVSVEQARPIRRSKRYYAWVVFFHSINLATLVLLVLQHYGWALSIFFLPAPWYMIQIMKASARGLGPAITRFATQRREVWLTIDDGPDPESTPKILAQLKAHGARATFFLIGNKVQRHPKLVAEILRHGHTIGNHTQSHPCSWFWIASAKKTAEEIDTCAKALRDAGAGTTPLFRPPVGLKNHPLHQQLAQRGLDLVLWSARGFDTVTHDPAKVLARIAADLRPGVIILVHENTSVPALQKELLPALLDHLTREGYNCVIPSTEALLRES
jgi:peptidoglycan/xylan/chitin deacetylase (PgdA/CDA1 family)